MLKEQLGQLCISATFALKAVNAARSKKKKITSPFLSFVLEVCCPNDIAPEGIQLQVS